MVPGRLSSLAVSRSDKALIPPAALRAPWGITETSGVVGCSFLEIWNSTLVSLADPTATRVARSGMYEPFVTNLKGARWQTPRHHSEGGRVVPGEALAV